MKNIIKTFLLLLVLSLSNTWYAEWTIESTSVDLSDVTFTTTSVEPEDNVVTEVSPYEDITYTYFYGQGCPHCAKVDKYLKSVDWYEKLGIDKNEIYYDEDNRAKRLVFLEKLGLDENSVWVPFLVLEKDWEYSYLSWDQTIIDYYTTILWEAPENNNAAIVFTILAILAILIPVALIKLSNKK